MIVTVKLFATLREGRFQIKELDLQDRATVSDIAGQIGIAEKELALMLVNGRHVELDHVLSDGDTLSLFPPVGGG